MHILRRTPRHYLLLAVLLPQRAAAAVFDGGGILEGLGAAKKQVAGLATGDVRSVAERILTTALSFLALAGVIMIILAGVYMIFNNGEDDSKEKAKKIIIYTLIGLVIVLCARVIVGFVTVVLQRAAS